MNIVNSSQGVTVSLQASLQPFGIVSHWINSSCSLNREQSRDAAVKTLQIADVCITPHRKPNEAVVGAGGKKAAFDGDQHACLQRPAFSAQGPLPLLLNGIPEQGFNT